MKTDEERKDTRVRRAFATYRALTSEQQGDVDERARQLAERFCDERNFPRFDVRTEVAGGLLYDVGRAWAQAFGREAPILPASISFARARERCFIETIYEQHRELMEKVAPKRRGEEDE